jgi:hypothetical protein
VAGGWKDLHGDRRLERFAQWLEAGRIYTVIGNWRDLHSGWRLEGFAQ